MEKFCPKCKKKKELKEFHKNKAKQDGLQDTCKLCCKIRDKKSYKGREKYYKTKSRDQYLRNKEFIQRYKKIFGKCVDCYISDWRVLDFDHVRGKKTYNVSDMKGSSIAMIKKEIKKCVIRCSNCHRIKTFERRNE